MSMYQRFVGRRYFVRSFDTRYSTARPRSFIGLAAAHAAGLIHRNIKPTNLLLDPDLARVKVADFGLVQASAEGSVLTAHGDLLGTPTYMSPEQITDPNRADARADVYGLGATLYEALTGVEPFRGTVAAVLERVRSADPLPPIAVNDAVPRDLDTVCRKAMSKESSGRYPSASAFAADLRRWLRGEPVQARPTGPIGGTWKWAKRNPRLALVSALFTASILASILLLAILWRRAENNADLVRSHANEIQKSRERSDERGLLALEAIHTMLSKAQQFTADRPGTLKLRQQFVEAALADLAKLSAPAPMPFPEPSVRSSPRN
jgi:serine/threonine protein kinase